MRPADLMDLPVRDAFDLADAALDPNTRDRPFSDDLTRAAELLDTFADI
jgi:histidine ammonia-lyase